MKEENEITQEVKELLDSLEQHGQNARRQKELSDLIDSLEAGSGTSLRGAELAERRGNPPSSTVDCFVADAPRNDAKRKRLYPIWWVMGAAAACLLLWLLARPAMKETPNMNEEILVEEIGAKDTIHEEHKTIEESVVLEEPIPEKLLAEEQPIQPVRPKASNTKPNRIEENFEEPLLAENNPSENIFVESTKSTDTANIGSNSIPNVIDEPIAVQSPQRRVIRSLNLVCYECQKEPEYVPQAMIEDRTIFGQLQDPNMKNGSWAFEVKLY